MLELCDKAESEYGDQPSLTEQALTAVLLSGFEKPLARLEASRINSNHVMVLMEFDEGEFLSSTGRTTTYRQPSSDTQLQVFAREIGGPQHTQIHKFMTMLWHLVTIILCPDFNDVISCMRTGDSSEWLNFG